MAIIVRVPGTCGEFIQGSIGGQEFLVTCPIDRYAMAVAGKEQGILPPKAEKARQITQKYLQLKNDIPISLLSQIERGKGMASSSADIAAVSQAVALAAGHELSYEEIMEICLSIEPSDAVVYPGCVQFDHLHGRINRFLGTVPESKIVMFDTGGTVDTVLFNKNKNLHQLRKQNESVMIKALSLFEKGIKNQDLNYIGRAATLSAFANQKLLEKPGLEKLWTIGKEEGCFGVIVAHSGTVLGLLCEKQQNVENIKRSVKALIPNLMYYDTVYTVSDGLICTNKEVE